MQLVEMEELPNYDDLEPGKFYFSRKYNISKHLCCCGCHSLIAVPIHFINDRRNNTNNANWVMTNKSPLTIAESFQHRGGCESHYLITNGMIDWRS